MAIRTPRKNKENSTQSSFGNNRCRNSSQPPREKSVTKSGTSTKRNVDPYKAKEKTTFAVKSRCTLEELLKHHMQGKSSTALKQLVAKGVFTLNGKALKRLDVVLEPGMCVTMMSKPEPQFKMPQGLKIVYEDGSLLVVNKDSGLLTIATDKETNRTAYTYLSAYLKFYNPDDKVFVVHRIDRDTSGLLIFAKNQKIQETLQRDWNKNIESRRYIAVCEGYPESDEGTIHTYIREHPKSLKMYVCEKDDAGAQEAITHYKVIKKRHGYAMVELQLETGRKNQIRIHLAHIGHPIAGDIKYGAQSNPADRLCLHAQQIEFLHPITHKKMNLTSSIPTEMSIIFEE
ncbi:MAG: RluA family pseudouridine synthase [Marinilabiliaceae bacterium]|nr:RluA family pseudouridine synthase [Marinilabiliaceae bacterium]